MGIAKRHFHTPCCPATQSQVGAIAESGRKRTLSLCKNAHKNGKRDGETLNGLLPHKWINTNCDGPMFEYNTMPIAA
jgi:hypothetical protein